MADLKPNSVNVPAEMARTEKRSDPPVALAHHTTKMVSVDAQMLSGIINQRDTYHYHVCRVVAALPVLLSELPKIQWMGLIGSMGINLTDLVNPFAKKKKGLTVSPEQLQQVLSQILADHPHLKTPITDLVTFWNTYQHINGRPEHL